MSATQTQKQHHLQDGKLKLGHGGVWGGEINNYLLISDILKPHATCETVKHFVIPKFGVKKIHHPNSPPSSVCTFPAKSWTAPVVYLSKDRTPSQENADNKSSLPGVFFSRAINQFGRLGTNKTYLNNSTVGGRNPLCTRFYASPVIQDFFHQQYHPSQGLSYNTYNFQEYHFFDTWEGMPCFPTIWSLKATSVIMSRGCQFLELKFTLDSTRFF